METPKGRQKKAKSASRKAPKKIKKHEKERLAKTCFESLENDLQNGLKMKQKTVPERSPSPQAALTCKRHYKK